MRTAVKALIFAGVFAVCGNAFAQEMNVGKTAEILAAEASERLSRDALQLGLSDLSEAFARDAVETAETEDMRERARLQLISALLERNQFDEARAQLAQCPDSPERSLREALLILSENGDVAAAQLALAPIVPEDLSPLDLPWYHLARALICAENNDANGMDDAFKLAISNATSSAQKLHFEFIKARTGTFFSGETISAEQLQQLKELMLRSRGTPESASFARLYIESLASAGYFADARETLAGLTDVPAAQRVSFDLLEALVQDSPSEMAAQRAFMRVIRARPDRQTQLIAFNGLWLGVALVAEGNRKDLAASMAAGIENFLQGRGNEFFAGTPLKPDLRVADLELMTRLRIAVEIGEIERAENFANQLIDKFPQSEFSQNALQFLAGLHYKRGHFLRAAQCFEKLMEKSAGTLHNIYQVAAGDCFAMAGDFAHASLVYAEASKTTSDPAMQALLMFQRVYTHIRSKDFDQAIALLDAGTDSAGTDSAGTDSAGTQISREPELNAWRMRAECVLISALRDAGKLDQALSRCRNLLDENDLFIDFRIRALWLQTLTAVELKLPNLIQKSSKELIDLLNNLPAGTSEVIVNQREDLLAWAQLQVVRGCFMQGRHDDAFKTLADLRKNYKDSVPAAISYTDEARFHAANANYLDALRCYEALISLAGTRPELANYAAIAYFEAAQQYLALGRERDAVQKYEQMLSNYPDSPLVFYARSRQADLLRAQNEFDAALAIYDALLVRFADHNDIRRIDIARADCLLAIASENRAAGTPLSEQISQIDRAISAYERLYSLGDSSCELMAEAGNKWAYAVAQKSSILAGTEAADSARLALESKKLYWRVADAVINKASDGNTKNPVPALGVSGAYWVSRSLFNLAIDYEKSNDFSSARDVYDTIILWSSNGWIPGLEYARSRHSAIKEK